MMGKRLNQLSRYRLDRVLKELKEIQAEQKFNKVDTWKLQEATKMIEQTLEKKGVDHAGD